MTYQLPRFATADPDPNESYSTGMFENVQLMKGVEVNGVVEEEARILGAGRGNDNDVLSFMYRKMAYNYWAHEAWPTDFVDPPPPTPDRIKYTSLELLEMGRALILTEKEAFKMARKELKAEAEARLAEAEAKLTALSAGAAQ